MRLRFLVLSALLGCGGGDASSTATVSGGEQPVTEGPAQAAAPAATGDTAAYADRWLIIATVSGPGLRAGSGVRFHAETMDVVSETRGDTFPIQCQTVEGARQCDVAGEPLRFTVLEDGLQLDGPNLHFTMTLADEAKQNEFEATLAAASAQRAACRAAATCCMDAEAVLGACDMNAVLGPRTVQSCTAALESLRSRLDAGRTERPTSCR